MKRGPRNTAWSDSNNSDPGLAFIELLAYLGDALTRYQDAVAAESYLRTRRRAAFALGAALACLIVWWRRDWP
jgi:hypothetical protein